MKSQQCCTVDEGLLPQPYMSITVLLLSFLLFSTWRDNQNALGLLIIEVSGAHAVVNSTLCRTPLDKWLDCRRTLPDHTQHSKEIETHAPSRIQMCNPSEQLQTYALGCIQT